MNKDALLEVGLISATLTLPVLASCINRGGIGPIRKRRRIFEFTITCYLLKKFKESNACVITVLKLIWVEAININRA